jgi:hypothetical protein
VTKRTLKFDNRIAAATKRFTGQHDARIFQAAGTVETAMKALDAIGDQHRISQELTPVFSALSLAADTLNQVAGELADAAGQ